MVVLAPVRSELDAPVVVAKLLARAFLTGSYPRERAPGDLTEDLLRLSPHVDTTNGR